MLWVWSVFGLPFLAACFEWFILGTRRRDQLRHITVIVAMIFATASAALGIWSLLHIEKLRLRARTDYGMESSGWLLATIALFSAITWVAVDRSWLSWLTLAISVWMFLTWGLICMTL